MTPGALWRRAARLYLRRKLGSLGEGSQLSLRGDYRHASRIEVGRDVYLGAGALLSARKGLRIEDGVVIGPRLVVMAGDHSFRTVGEQIKEAHRGPEGPVVIQTDAWLGARVTILKGVTIGEGAIIGAGSVVTRDVSPYCIYAGNPARRIGLRFTREELAEHLGLVGSSLRIEDLEHLYE